MPATTGLWVSAFVRPFAAASGQAKFVGPLLTLLVPRGFKLLPLAARLVTGSEGGPTDWPPGYTAKLPQPRPDVKVWLDSPADPSARMRFSSG
jgi:hypothetical protein